MFAAPRHCVKFIARLTVMRAMNELLAIGPFDLYELQLFHLVAEHRNFTKAGQAAGLTQSAITRQIAGMEARLGLPLFERTTRSVRLTPAGAMLYARSGAILAGVDDALKSLQTRFELGPPVLRVGIARTIGLAYLPGFFRKFQRAQPTIQIRATHQSSAFILAAVEGGELDTGLIAAPPILPSGIVVARKFTDEFVAIAPPIFDAPSKPIAPAQLNELFRKKKWLLISDDTITGKKLRAWLQREGVQPEVTMDSDSFDLIVNLVSLGFGVSIVPHRVLALHPQTRPVRRIIVKPKFTRELILVVRQQQSTPKALSDFVESILF
jgi:DNA-binding transcriptional LysR family regulator